MLFFTLRFIISSLATTALLLASSALSNPIESTKSTLALHARAIEWKSCAGDLSGQTSPAYVCCTVTQDGDSFTYLMSVKDSRVDSNTVWGTCSLRYLNGWQYGVRGSSNKPYEIFKYGPYDAQGIVGIQAWACINYMDDTGPDSHCNSGAIVNIP